MAQRRADLSFVDAPPLHSAPYHAVFNQQNLEEKEVIHIKMLASQSLQEENGPAHLFCTQKQREPLLLRKQMLTEFCNSV